MNFKSTEYLPNSEKRIAQLQKIIGGRPVAILAAGPSIKELEKRISELRNADICYFGFNKFIQEKFILRQINKNLSVYMDSCGANTSKTIKNIIDFLNRDESNVFISSFWQNAFLKDSNFDTNQFLSKYDQKLIFFSLGWERTIPNAKCPLHFIVSNSLLVLIELAIIGKASKIVIFGADGYSKNSIGAYYCQNEYRPYITSRVNDPYYLIDDTNKYFNPIALIALRNVYRTYSLAPIEILNCSPNSMYTPFPIVSYDDAFECLLKGRKFNIKWDLRVPKVSVITLCVNFGEFMKETVENVFKQSYSNYEHIVVCGEVDDKTKETIQQFHQVRLISEKNIGYLQAFKKAVLMARGEYILYFRMGDGYLNQDWFNTCVEVLENKPEISLVWGLSQYILEDGALGRIPDARLFCDLPAQGKNYIYYWLKRKSIFPEGSLCVRKRVLQECFPFDDPGMDNERAGWLTFNYRFNTSGHLPYFVPVVVNYSRPESDTQGYRQRITFDMRNFVNIYFKDIKEYKRKLFIGKIIYRYRSGTGELLTGGFSRGIFIFFDIGRQAKFKIFNMAIRVKSKLPDACCAVIDKILFFWRVYKWNALKVALVRIWFRLTKILVQRNCQ